MDNKFKKCVPFRLKGRYYNFKGEMHKGFVLSTLFMLCGSIFHRIANLWKDKHQWVSTQKPVERSESCSITWIGHATFLIQIGSINILVDPIFGSPSVLFRRILSPGISLENLPPIDVILISHAHADHMEQSTLLKLKKCNPAVVVPLGIKEWFDKQEFNSSTELSWWQHKKLTVNGTDITLTLLPAKHWSQRSLSDKNKSLWGSWMIECNGRTIYFAGDTIYSDHFKHISDEFKHIDVALLPIGPCEPHRFMKHCHMNAEGAGKAFCDLNAQHLIPMHWGTFPFGCEPFELPIKRLQQWVKKNQSNLDKKNIHTPKCGQRLNF